jgi:heat shock protein HslJ
MKNIFIYLGFIVLFFTYCAPASKKTSTNGAGQISATAVSDDSVVADMLDGYWKLIEIGGRAVDDSVNNVEPHLVINESDGRFSANAGCNGIGGNFLVKPMNRVTFANVIRTQMACPQMELENELVRVLEMADNYNISNDVLALNKARMSPLARFRRIAGKR